MSLNHALTLQSDCQTLSQLNHSKDLAWSTPFNTCCNTRNIKSSQCTNPSCQILTSSCQNKKEANLSNCRNDNPSKLMIMKLWIMMIEMPHTCFKMTNLFLLICSSCFNVTKPNENVTRKYCSDVTFGTNSKSHDMYF